VEKRGGASVRESAGFCLVRFLLAVIGNAGRHHLLKLKVETAWVRPVLCGTGFFFYCARLELMPNFFTRELNETKSDIYSLNDTTFISTHNNNSAIIEATPRYLTTHAMRSDCSSNGR